MNKQNTSERWSRMYDMVWYKDLYVGESIVHKTKKVKWKIMHNAGQIGIYVITLASNTQNLLDIIPSYELMQKGIRKRYGGCGTGKGL